MKIKHPNHPPLPLSNSQITNRPQPAQPPEKHISPAKIKPVFQTRVIWRDQTSSSFSKYRLKGLSTLKITCHESQEVNSKKNKRIYQCLKKCLKGNKRRLSLKIVGVRSGSANLKGISPIISTAVDLKGLSINFDHIDLKSSKEVFKGLKKCRNLSCLKVLIGASHSLTKAIFAHLFQKLKGLRKLKEVIVDRSLYPDDTPPENNEPNASIFTFSYPRALKSLSINFLMSTLPKPEMLESFASKLSKCQNLESLDLDCRKIYSGTNSFLSHIFQKTQNLKTLCIKKACFDLEQIEESQNFVNDLQHLKQITSLDLKVSCHGSYDASEQFFQGLFKNLASLTNLKSLILGLQVESHPSGDRAYENILLLKSLSQLQTLSLTVASDHENPNTPLLKNFFQAFQSLSCLKDLSLFLLEYEVSEQDIFDLSQMFQKLGSLENLSLTLGHQYLQEKTFEILFQSIAHLTLTSFLFHVKQVDVDDYLPYNQKLYRNDELTSLFSTIRGFTSLSSLDLDLLTFFIVEEDIKNLSDTLEDLRELTHLSLEIFCQNARNLFSSFREKPKLKSLKLLLKGHVLDEEVILLTSILEGYGNNLETLYLEFEAYRLSDKSLLAIERGIRNLLSLSNLAIILNGKRLSQRKASLKLLDALALLKNLETVEIDNAYRSELQDFEILLRNMGRHWNLKIFQVNNKHLI